MRILSFIYALCIVACSFAQERSCHLWLNEVPLVADTVAGKIYATLEPNAAFSLRGTLRWDSETYDSVAVNGKVIDNAFGNFAVNDWSASTDNKLSLYSKGEAKEWKMVFTTLPIVLLEANQSKLYEVWKADNDLKSPATITVIDARARTRDGKQQLTCFSSGIGIRVRGATSAGKEKKSFAIELRDENGEKKNAHVLGYRDDNDWILDAMFNDFSKMRNRVMTDLWKSIDDLPYSKDNDYQGNGTQGEFVEVFMEGKYWGLYCLTDKIDRKKLNLKKTQNEDTAEEVKRGLLWKSKFRCGATTFANYDAYPTNDTLVWEQYWEQKYPNDRQDQGFFSPIADMIDALKANHKKKSIVEAAENAFYIDNVINFIICTQAFQWMDNLQKNMYLSIRNVEKDTPVKLLITPWDLDASCGRDAGGDPLTDDKKWLAFGEQLGGINNLIWNLSHYYTEDFATKLVHRWEYLKTHELSLETVRRRMTEYADQFTRSGAWDREYAFAKSMRASGKEPKQATTPYEEIDFIMEFLTRNYEAFDEKVAKWGAKPYEEPVLEVAEKAIYIVSNDVESRHEDCATILPGEVNREVLEEGDSITYSDTGMRIVREEGEVTYAIESIKEVKTTAEGLYPTAAFLPEEYRDVMNFDTRFGSPIASASDADTLHSNGFQRTVEIVFDGDTAKIVGNTFGIEIKNEKAHVSIATDIEDVLYVISGMSDSGTLSLQGKNPSFVAAKAGEKARIAAISSVSDVILCGKGALNLVYDAPTDSSVNVNNTLLRSNGNVTIESGVVNMFSSAFNGKGVHADGKVAFNGGDVNIITIGSGTLTDATFPKDAELGTRAVLAETVDVNGGRLRVKTFGHNGGVGLAGVKSVTFNGGEAFLACYDDPIKSGESVAFNGGLTISSSLTNDGVDCKGSISMTGGTLFSYGPDGAEGCFDNNGKTFAVSGGTIIGVAYKGDAPQASKSSQASFRYYKQKDIKEYVRIANAQGETVMEFETPAYTTMTLVVTSPFLQKEETYAIMTSDTKDGEYTKATDIKAE